MCIIINSLVSILLPLNTRCSSSRPLYIYDNNPAIHSKTKWFVSATRTSQDYDVFGVILSWAKDSCPQLFYKIGVTFIQWAPLLTHTKYCSNKDLAYWRPLGPAGSWSRLIVHHNNKSSRRSFWLWPPLQLIIVRNIGKVHLQYRLNRSELIESTAPWGGLSFCIHIQ